MEGQGLDWFGTLREFTIQHYC